MIVQSVDSGGFCSCQKYLYTHDPGYILPWQESDHARGNHSELCLIKITSYYENSIWLFGHVMLLLMTLYNSCSGFEFASGGMNTATIKSTGEFSGQIIWMMS